MIIVEWKCIVEMQNGMHMLTCNWLYLIYYMFYYKVNGSWIAKTLDSLQRNPGSNLNTNKGN
jgi:hypothetical protein